MKLATILFLVCPTICWANEAAPIFPQALTAEYSLGGHVYRVLARRVGTVTVTCDGKVMFDGRVPVRKSVLGQAFDVEPDRSCRNSFSIYLYTRRANSDGLMPSENVRIDVRAGKLAGVW